jgi:hypothetical protein
LAPTTAVLTADGPAGQVDHLAERAGPGARPVLVAHRAGRASLVGDRA